MEAAHLQAAKDISQQLQVPNPMKCQPVMDITTYALRTQGFANVEFYLMKKSKETTNLEASE